MLPDDAAPVFLNRPLITILEQLGVPGRVFLGLQQSMVLQLCDAFVSNEAALGVLCTYTNASLPFLKMHLRGLALSREPFTRSLLLAVYKSMIGEWSGTLRGALQNPLAGPEPLLVRSAQCRQRN